ncbi:MAG: transcriptional repressor NrdR [Planctomycetes bacterium]|nr:transcriptional repressor NrdR [Planctomycetota bacterium]
MRCPYCKHDEDKVVDSRAAAEGTIIRRRRECLECNRRFTTYERIEEGYVRVVKKDSSRAPFDRRRILAGLMRACEKRPVSADTLERVVSEIEHEIYERFDKEVPTKFIGELVMQKLRALDDVAYIRFASVYREFKDVSEFVTEARPMLRHDRKKK